MKPGVYPGLSYEQYEKIDAVRWSILRLMGRSPAHARAEQLHPVEPTPAREFGQWQHHAVLEPVLFTERYAAVPKVDRRTKAGKEAWARFEVEHAGKTLVRQDQYDDLLAVQKAVWEHPIIKAILSDKGMSEVTIVWVDPETGLKCKARMDWFGMWGKWSIVGDLKTTLNASEDAWSREVARYQYQGQAGYYLMGLDELSPLRRRWLWFAVEKARPYACAVYEPDNNALTSGRTLARRYLDAYQNATESGHWPGYPSEVRPCALPAWAIEYEDPDWMKDEDDG